MKFIIILILLAFTVTLSFGYKQLCLGGRIKTCTLYMTNNETAYTNVFIRLIPANIEIAIDYEFGENKNKADPYKTVNELIRDEVKDETINDFLKEIDSPFKYPTSVRIIPDLNKVNGTKIDTVFSFKYSTETTTTPIPTTSIPTTTQKTTTPPTTTERPTTARPTTSRPITTRPSRPSASRAGGIGYLLMGK